MKLSDIPIGSRILVPCPRCGDKKSRILRSHFPSALKKMKEQVCRRCSASDNLENGSMYYLPNWNKGRGI